MHQSQTQRLEDHKRYLEENVQIYFKPLAVAILKEKPNNVLGFIVDWCQTKGVEIEKGQKPLVENKSLANIDKKSVIPASVKELHKQSQSKLIAESQNYLPASEDEEDDYFEEEEAALESIEQRRSTHKKKMAISAEVYGEEGIENFVPKVVPKDETQKAQIRQTLLQNIIFSSLDSKQQEIIIDSMEIKNFAAEECVIKQGDDGNELYIVGSGQLRCTKLMPGAEEPTFLKNYLPGEVFGELALMYNAPRAATIVAIEPSQLYSMDRETFNNIVKVAAIRQRQRFESFLRNIDILKDLNDYEKAKICDCLKTEQFNKNDLVIRENEPGDKFYLIQEGTAVAIKTEAAGNEEKVYEYKENDYFGELALLKNDLRKATIRVTSDKLVVASMDRMSFKRLLGPVDSILKRNMERYEKYAKK